MKLLLTMLIVCSLQAGAQVKNLYFKGRILLKEYYGADSYGFFGKLKGETRYTLKKYNLNNELILVGSYLDENMQIPDGQFMVYKSVRDFNDRNRTFVSDKKRSSYNYFTGSFINGIPDGRWCLYYPNGNVKESVYFVNGKMEGDYFAYKLNGKVDVSGKYVTGELDGEWVNKSGNEIRVYQKGLLLSRGMIDPDWVIDNKAKFGFSIQDAGFFLFAFPS